MIQLKIKWNKAVITVNVTEATEKTDLVLTKLSAWNLINAGYNMTGIINNDIQYDAVVEDNHLIINGKWSTNSKIHCDIMVIRHMIEKNILPTQYNYHVELIKFLCIGTEKRYPTQYEIDECLSYMKPIEMVK